MARFDIYKRDDGPGFLVDLQSDLLAPMNTRVVAPLLPQDAAPSPAAYLNPLFDIDGTAHVLVTQFLSAVPVTLTKTPYGSLSDHADTITRAIDMVFQGI
ncbi:MAG: CcdB family protein [Pseudomonadota bacterium]